MKKKILGTSNAWSTIHLSHWPSKPAYYIVDCQIFAGTYRPVIHMDRRQTDILDAKSSACEFKKDKVIYGQNSVIPSSVA